MLSSNTSSPQAIAHCQSKIDQCLESYKAEDVPVKSYLALASIFSVAFGAAYVLTTSRKKPLRREPTSREFLTLAIASYKLSRIVTMSFIASPMRAPFTTRGESLKGGEVQDVSRGTGMQKAIGNLLTCPFCFNVWSATAFAFAHLNAPKFTTTFARVLSMAAIGDFLHFGYRNIRESSL